MAEFRVAGTVECADPTALLREHGARWHPTEPILDEQGRRLSSVWEDEEGSVFLPFDPGEVMHCLWSEAYRSLGQRRSAARLARAMALRVYYAVRPLVPRRIQLRMRRAVAGRPLPDDLFPAWPAEHGLHEMYEWLLATIAGVAGEPVPWIAPWPEGKRWAMVLSHDVETRHGLDEMELLRAEERSRGYRSAWYFVPERVPEPYEVTDALVEQVKRDGCEVGVHGLRHDGKDLSPRQLLRRRLPEIQRYAAAWGAAGFRAPALHRSWQLMPMLGVEYDSSYFDTDPYEPQPGGCCAYLPFFNGELVELPITLPQDHTLFEILQQRTGQVWLEKARELRRRGGMVLALSHPDYARNPNAFQGWRALLEEFKDDPTRWQPLPHEVASWWRERAASVLVRKEGGWAVSGPGAGRARVCLTGQRASSRPGFGQGAESLPVG